MPHSPIRTDRAPQAIGAYSQAIRAGNVVYISGQLPLDPQTMQLVSGDIDAEIRRALACRDRGGAVAARRPRRDRVRAAPDVVRECGSHRRRGTSANRRTSKAAMVLPKTLIAVRPISMKASTPAMIAMASTGRPTDVSTVASATTPPAGTFAMPYRAPVRCPYLG